MFSDSYSLLLCETRAGRYCQKNKMSDFIFRSIYNFFPINQESNKCFPKDTMSLALRKVTLLLSCHHVLSTEDSATFSCFLAEMCWLVQVCSSQRGMFPYSQFQTTTFFQKKLLTHLQFAICCFSCRQPNCNLRVIMELQKLQGAKNVALLKIKKTYYIF